MDEKSESYIKDKDVNGSISPLNEGDKVYVVTKEGEILSNRAYFIVEKLSDTVSMIFPVATDDSTKTNIYIMLY